MNAEAEARDLVAFYGEPGLLRERQRGYAVPVSGRSFAGWVLDRVELGDAGRVLDAGAGVGRFTVPVRLGHSGAQVVAVDLFGGMLETIGEQVEGVGAVVADIQALPFGAGCFDLVLANHVLYHLPDLDRGVRELGRVTRSSGTFVATTNADDVAVAVVDLHLAALERIGWPAEPEGASAFSLRNGGEVLGRVFEDVRLFTFRDELVYADAAALVGAYRTTGRFRAASLEAGPELGAAASVVAAEWLERAGGALVSPVVMGAFVCSGGSGG